jgi:hypothetical protein
MERIFLHVPEQAHSQGDARECNTSTRNLQNFKDKHADQSAKKGMAPFCLHTLPLLNNCNWKQLIIKNVHICKMVLQCFRVHQVIKVSKHHFSSPEKGAYYAYMYVSYKHTHTYSVMHNTPLHVHISICTYMHLHWKLLHSQFSCGLAMDLFLGEINTVVSRYSVRLDSGSTSG